MKMGFVRSNERKDGGRGGGEDGGEKSVDNSISRVFVVVLNNVF